MLVGAVVVMLLAIGVMAAPVPYVVLSPGPTVDTLGEQDGVPVIAVAGTESSDSEGQLLLTTAGVTPGTVDLSLLEVMRAWFDDETAVVPREMIYPPDQSTDEVEQRNREQFTRSHSAAEVAALRHLGYPARVVVHDVVEGAPADGRLRSGDQITAVDGTAVESAAQLQELVSGQPVGTTVTIEYVREGAADVVEVTTAADGADGETPRVGVAIAEEMDVPFELSIELDRIGGPSAGLMFALGIIDRLEPSDLTGGLVIAGTGVIDEQGTVGAIGSIPQKLVGAREAGATAFLVPAPNCAEAVRNAQPGLTMVRVETLADALDGLAALREGQQPATC